MEKEKKRNYSFIVILLLCALLLGITLAYVVLSSTFSLTFGKINTFPVAAWNVAFESGIVAGENVGSAATICGNANVTSNTVAVDDITFNSLHDKCVYKLKVKNTGAVSAKLTSIVPKAPIDIACDTSKTSSMKCENITYRLTNDKEGLSLVGTGNSIPPSIGTMDLYLITEYSGSEDSVTGAQIGGGFAVTFSQK